MSIGFVGHRKLSEAQLRAVRALGATATVTDPEGDSVSVTATDPAPSTNTICGPNWSIESYEWVVACGDVALYDATTGTEAPNTNWQYDYFYDACGNEVMGNSSAYWGLAQGYVSSGWFTSYTNQVPVGTQYCSGTWTLVYEWSEKFHDGVQLTASASDTFQASILSPPPSSATGVGQGESARHKPTCNCKDPVNTASGNFSESFTDVAVPGRGPALALNRTYNSLLASTAGPFGYGWSSSYDSHLSVNSDGSVTVTEADGSQVTAQPSGSGGYVLPLWSDSTLTANADGTWRFVRQRTMAYTYNAGGQLVAIQDTNGYTTSLSYNSAGQLTTVTDPEQRSLTFQYGPNGLVSEVTDPANQVTDYSYDGSNNLVGVTDVTSGQEWQFGYDASHYLTTVTDPDQAVTTNVYNSSGQVTQQIDAANQETNFAYSGDAYSSAGSTTTITGPHGQVTAHGYTDGLLMSVTTDAGASDAATWNYQYDPTLGLNQITDPRGNVTAMSYDADGDVTSYSDADGATWNYTYNGLDEPLTMSEPNGAQVSWTYDAAGNVQSATATGAGGSPTENTTLTYGDSEPGDVTQVADGADHQTNYTYDIYGDVASVTTHPSTNVNDTTANVFDVLGRLVCQASPDATANGVQCPAAGGQRVADTSTWAYNSDNEVVTATDADGNTTHYAYDGEGNVTQVTDALGNIAKIAYDGDSRVTSVTNGVGTPQAAQTSYSYDIAPGSGGCSSSVAGAAYCVAITDPGGQSSVAYLNTLDEVIERTEPGSGVSTATYDPDGNVETLTSNGGTATYGYDGDNHLTSVAYSSPATGFIAASNISYGYNNLGNLDTMTDASGTTTYGYDTLGRLSSIKNGAGTQIGYGYTSANQIASVTYPASKGTEAVTESYDGAGRESSLTDWLNKSTSFTYDADGNLASTVYPNNTTASSTYDPADNLLSTSLAPTSNPSSPLAKIAYTYNADNQVASESDSGLPGPSATNYGYDPLGRLTSAGPNNYGYDASGDPTQLGQQTATYNQAEQVTALNSTISRVGSSSAGDSGTGSSLTLSLPSGTQANDQILLAVTLPGNQSIKSTPSGYTKVGSYSSGTTSTGVQLVLYRRTAQAGDTTASITFSKTFAKAATAIVYRGVNPQSPIDVSSSNTTGSGTSVTAPSITTTSANDEIVLADGALSTASGSWTAPSGMTTRVTQAGGTGIAASIADQAGGAAGPTGSQTASLSTTGALAAVLIALKPAANSYSYDSLGDRTAFTTPAGTTTASYNQAGQMTAFGSTSYTYNGLGLRTTKKTGTTSEQMTWGQPAATNGIPAVLIDGSSDYIYGPDGHPLEQINGSTALYYLQDQLGSTRALTNSTGALADSYTYAPYGALTGSTGTNSNPFQYAGAFSDSESGLSYMLARYYDSMTGEFGSVDPLVAKTQEPYSYTGDDPTNGVDPLGLDDPKWGLEGGAAMHNLCATQPNDRICTYGDVSAGTIAEGVIGTACLASVIGAAPCALATGVTFIGNAYTTIGNPCLSLGQKVVGIGVDAVASGPGLAGEGTAVRVLAGATGGAALFAHGALVKRAGEDNP